MSRQIPACGLATNFVFLMLSLPGSHCPFPFFAIAYNHRLKATTMDPQNPPVEISCKLTSEALQKRKRTLIAALAEKIRERRAVEHGFAFRFTAEDSLIDTLAAFIKSERACCSFLQFNLQVSGTETLWLTLTGPEGTREFMQQELGL